MKYITVKLTEDQVRHLIGVLTEKVQKDNSAYSTRIVIKLTRAWQQPKS